ncbi:hypothetical protein F2P56_007669 [Juglans regia]|uniref:Uncharacterized protein LOC109020428 n=2 Tax=Juglans regia TaxID=51240 RepID=A0A2I4HQJ4_JUGRE|nr:uncharacterized protein LOC109020428 [Juglans regia]KAF5475913.1 hypothetical protein F2P56_007669 [Juglans regia]
MSANSAHIDLNSDVLPFDLENMAHGVTDSEPVTLTETFKVHSQVQGSPKERIVDEVGNFSGAKGLEIGGSDGNAVLEPVIDGLEKEALKRVTHFADGANVSEAETGMVDRGVNLKDGDVSLGLVKEDVNASDCMQEGIEPQVESVSKIPAEIPGVEAKVADINETFCDENSSVCPTHVSEALTSEGSENRTMNIDAMIETNKNQTASTRVPEAGVVQNIGDDSNIFNLVVDLNTYTITDGNVSSDVNVKSAASNPEFHVSDLVWGKVRSHPWWPGQIFDPSDSSENATKYSKKGSYLIAYFGDQTFAWNEASWIKPFGPHFSQMEKQSTKEEFRYALDCALEEVSRRVEFGLACSCISKEAYAKLNTQIIVNAGIREESSRRDGGDSYLNATSLKPAELLEFMKTTAQLPYGGGDRLEFVMSHAQLSAFYRWKGYSELPKFNMLGTLFGSEEDNQLLGVKKNHAEFNVNDVLDMENDNSISSGKGKSETQVSSSRKRKHTSGDSLLPNKKERSLLDLLVEKGSRTPNGGNKTGKEGVGKLISQSSSQKRKAVDALSDDSSMKRAKSHLSTGVVDAPARTRQTFRVGDSIRRAASQMNGSSPILKYGDGMSQEARVENKSIQKKPSTELPSPDEMMSQLCLAARDPMKGYSFIFSMVGFFSEFRNFVSLDDPSLEEHEQSLKQVFGGKTRKKSTKTGRKSTMPGITEASGTDVLSDSYWSDRIVQSIPEEQSSFENQPDSPSGKGYPTVEPQRPNLDHTQKRSDKNLESEAGMTIGHHLEEESCEQDFPPTALILNFTDLDSVPSEASLTKIFSQFGTLIECQTEVLKKSRRAKVVFKKRDDAETAFSSAGKYSIFGPSLVSYRLKYIMPSNSKASAPTKRGGKVTATSL